MNFSYWYSFLARFDDFDFFRGGHGCGHFPKFLGLGTLIFEFLVDFYLLVPIFGLIQQLFNFRGGASGCGHFPKFLGLGTLIFEFPVDFCPLVLIFGLIQQLFYFRDGPVGWSLPEIVGSRDVEF